MSSLNGEVILADQNKGESIQLRIYGDEFYARRENVEGYTVIYDTEKRCYCYAILASGYFISSGIPVYKTAPRGLRKHLKEDPEVRNEKFGLKYDEFRSSERHSDLNNMRTLGHDCGLLSGRKLHKGHIKGLTVLVNFDDIKTNIPPADVESMFNSDNYTANGNFCSVKTYFQTMSSNKLTYTNLIVGPIQLSKRRSFYINNLLVEEAMDIVVNDLNIDLKQFDSKNEGIVDAINLLYAGESQYDGNIWPHNSYETLRYGTMRTHYYQITGLGLHSVDLRIGTICHENGHLLCRFPDLYDYGRRDGDFERSQGIGRYCLMSSGSHLNQQRTPAPVCGYLRELAGWVDTVVDLNTPGIYSAEHGTYNTILKYSTDKANEYFIVENRTDQGLDSYLPSNGLAVLHCDTLGSNEWQDGTRNRHYQCALLQADGHLDLENNRNSGDQGDLFKAQSGIVLSDTTIPSSREWDDTDSGFQIRNLTAPGYRIDFTVGIPQQINTIHSETSPHLVIPDDNPSGISSSLGIPNSGEINNFSVRVEIIHSWINDLKVILYSPNGTEVLLHDREGSNGDDIMRTWTSDTCKDLRRFFKEDVRGNWILKVIDKASADVGRLLFWEMDIGIKESTGGIIEKQLTPKLIIPDNNNSGITSNIRVAQSGTVKNIAISVDIQHTYIGDLQVELVSPSGAIAVLHDEEGNWRNNINRSYEAASTTALQKIIGESVSGDWQLRIRDLARMDQGQLNSWSIKIWN